MRCRALPFVLLGLAGCSDPATDDGDTGSTSAAAGTMSTAGLTTTLPPSTSATSDATAGLDTTAAASTGPDGSSSDGTGTTSTSSSTTDASGSSDGSTTGSSASPAVVHVAAGTRHTCAVLEGGAVKCWGDGFGGALGYGNVSSIGNADTPADHGPVDIGGTAVEVAAGFGFSCALRDDGAVLCWGATPALGYGNTDFVGDDELPVDVGPIDVGEPVEHITAGSGHVCATLTGGEVKCWGTGGRGQLGQGDEESIGDDELPSSIDPIDLGGPAQAVHNGFDYTCAWLVSGEIRCWGYGAEGRLGQGDTVDIGDDELPLAVPPVDVGPGIVAGLSVGSSHVCVSFDDGGVSCWGVGFWGQLGYGNVAHVGDDELPVAAGAVALGMGATAVWANAHNTCAKLDDADLRCWGHGLLGANGNASTQDLGDDETPLGLPAVDLGAEALVLSQGQGEHFCAIASEGLVCWGASGWGQLGYGMPGIVGNDEVPADVGFVPL